LSGVEPGENLDVALGAAMAVLPGVGLLSLVWLVGLYALAVGVALIVLALRLRGLRRGRGLQGVLNPRGGNK
jgi:uncharacterized membrane protein HdeD (DUF308 family)